MISVLRPRATPGLSLATLAARVGAVAADHKNLPDLGITGVTLRAQDAAPGDLFAALPGATAHGAEFTAAAIEAGAVAVLTDAAGAAVISGSLPDPSAVPVLVHPAPSTATPRTGSSSSA